VPDFEQYRQEMASYYDHASQVAYLFDAAEFARQYDAVYAEEGSWLRDLALAIQDITRGKRVLEIASGHGRWTRYIAQVASRVLATDASDRMLAQARQVVNAGGDLSRLRCTFARVDAFEIDRVEGAFDCAVTVNFFQHIPIKRHGAFLDALHRKLQSGTQVLIAVNRLQRQTRARLFRKPGEDDLFDLRLLIDGRVYEIIDNVFQPEQLRDRVRDFSIHRGKKFDWVTYVVP